MDFEDLADLRDEVRHLLNTWDPIGVHDFSIRDEYDCLISPLLTRLSIGQGVPEISEYLWFELEDHFGIDPAAGDSDGFALRLVVWFRGRDPGAK